MFHSDSLIKSINRTFVLFPFKYKISLDQWKLAGKLAISLPSSCWYEAVHFCYTYIRKGKLGRGTKNTAACEHEESRNCCTWPSLHQQAPKYVCWLHSDKHLPCMKSVMIKRHFFSLNLHGVFAKSNEVVVGLCTVTAFEHCWASVTTQ
jgi:hypothetical protein